MRRDARLGIEQLLSRRGAARFERAKDVALAGRTAGSCARETPNKGRCFCLVASLNDVGMDGIPLELPPEGIRRKVSPRETTVCPMPSSGRVTEVSGREMHGTSRCAGYLLHDRSVRAVAMVNGQLQTWGRSLPLVAPRVLILALQEVSRGSKVLLSQAPPSINPLNQLNHTRLHSFVPPSFVAFYRRAGGIGRG